MKQTENCIVASEQGDAQGSANMPVNGVEPANDRHINNNQQIDSFEPALDNKRQLRQALGCFGTGVTVVTIFSPDGPFGMTVNSFSSVSLDPPLILWSVDKGSERCAYFESAERFTVNVLQESQRQLAIDFASDPMAFRDTHWHEGANGSPVLTGSLATFECELETCYAGGDHTIILGRVLRATVNNGAPLLFYGGKFGSVAVG